MMDEPEQSMVESGLFLEKSFSIYIIYLLHGQPCFLQLSVLEKVFQSAQYNLAFFNYLSTMLTGVPAHLIVSRKVSVLCGFGEMTIAKDLQKCQ